MSTTKIRFPRAAALAVADHLQVVLSAVCDKIVIAGSVRRGKPTVGDIELLFIPKFAWKPNLDDLLREPVMTNLAENVINELLKQGVLSKRLKEDGSKTWGPLIKLAVHNDSGIPVDFFQATPDNWWSLLVCRTGSAESNERLCNAAIARGLQWSPYEGIKDRASKKLLFVPTSERALFTRLGLPYLQPQSRI